MFSVGVVGGGGEDREEVHGKDSCEDSSIITLQSLERCENGMVEPRCELPQRQLWG